MASDTVGRQSSRYTSLLGGGDDESEGVAAEEGAPAAGGHDAGSDARASIAAGDSENVPLAPAADVGESNNDKPIGSSREAASRCSHKKVIASSSVLIVGTMCCAAVLYYMAAPPMQLTVDSLSPSGLNATFTRPDLNTTVSASTSNSSFATTFDGRSLFSKKREVIAGFRLVRTTILHASFITLDTVQNRSITVQASPDAPPSEPFLRLIYGESPDIRFAIEQAVVAQGQVMDALLANHKHILNAFVDMVWNLGEVKHISGADHPHVLELYMLAMELAKDMDRSPQTIGASSPAGDDDGRRRRLQSSGCSCPSNLPTCGSDGWCYSGTDYSGGSECGARWGSTCGESYSAASHVAASVVSSDCTCGSSYPTCGVGGWCYLGSDYSGGSDCGARFGSSCGHSHTARDEQSDSWGCTCPSSLPTCNDGWCYHGSDYSDGSANCGARFGATCTQSSTVAHASDSCSLERDPQNDCCDGMCGEGCNCWSYACGDCCAHPMCVDHDECCRTLGMASSACVGIAFSYDMAQCGEPYALHTAECAGCTCGSSYPSCGTDGWCYSQPGSDYSTGSGCGARHGSMCMHSHDGQDRDPPGC